MKKILFSHSYFLQLDPKQLKNGQPYPPLGTLYAAAVMRKGGYEVSLHDVQFTKGPEELNDEITRVNPDYFVIYDDGFNYLTKMCLSNMRAAAFRMIGMAKEKGALVIVSSSDSTDRYQLYLDAGADFVILGEGEYTLLELVKNLDVKQGQEIPGVAYKMDGRYVKTGPRPVIKDLDQLPFPAWDLLDIRPYRETWLQRAGFFSINVSTTRGCPFKCNWCAKPIYGNRYNAHSPARVVQEIKILVEQYGAEHVWFCDDIFGLKPGWVNEFADQMQHAGLKVRFKIQSRADLLAQEGYVKALARAGCDVVWMGAESGSQKILDAMDKGVRVAQIEEATSLLKKHRIRPAFFIQFGYPGETMEDIRKTIKLINRLMPFEIGISVSYPLPGTVFHEKVKEQLKAKSNWTDSDELALMFSNTYPPPFYRLLHRFVHRNYKYKLALLSFLQLLKRPMQVKWAVYRKAMSAFYIFPCLLIDKVMLKRWQKA